MEFKINKKKVLEQCRLKLWGHKCLFGKILRGQSKVKHLWLYIKYIILLKKRKKWQLTDALPDYVEGKGELRNNDITYTWQPTNFFFLIKKRAHICLLILAISVKAFLFTEYHWCFKAWQPLSFSVVMSLICRNIYTVFNALRYIRSSIWIHFCISYSYGILLLLKLNKHFLL